jgi:hypothetical protein
MNPHIDEVALIESALAAIEQVLARAAADQEPVPFHGETLLAGLPAEEREALMRIEAESYRTRPDHSAIHFCLRSATALLDVSQQLLRPPVHPSPQQQEYELKRLVAHTKTAGRAAYRAALILMDTKTTG